MNDIFLSPLDPPALNSISTYLTNKPLVHQKDGSTVDIQSLIDACLVVVCVDLLLTLKVLQADRVEVGSCFRTRGGRSWVSAN